MSRSFKAGCLAVGSELLGTYKLDRNSLVITRTLEYYGFDVIEKRVVGDTVDGVAEAISDMMKKVEVLVVTGGLGPTADDVTRQAVALATGRKLLHDPETETLLEKRYHQMGREMPDICRVMADTIEGARLVKNDRGSAPGILLEENGCLLAVFPGVPYEMQGMLETELGPELERKAGRRRKLSRTLLLGGVVESETEARIRHLYDDFGRDNITILASYGVLRLSLSTRGDREDCAEILDQMETAFREILGDDVAGVDEESLAKVAVGHLVRRKETLGTAESCTGGMVGMELTSVPGASEVFLGGVVSYSNEIKENLLGVPRAVLENHGAVSRQTAISMAECARELLGTTWGLGVTGIAGPGGGTEEKPVGLVHWAVAGSEGTVSRHRIFPGDRGIIRQWSTNAVLDLLRRRLL